MKCGLAVHDKIIQEARNDEKFSKTRWPGGGRGGPGCFLKVVFFSSNDKKTGVAALLHLAYALAEPGIYPPMKLLAAAAALNERRIIREHTTYQVCLQSAPVKSITRQTKTHTSMADGLFQWCTRRKLHTYHCDYFNCWSRY